LAAAFGVGATLGVGAIGTHVHASGTALHPHQYEWPHDGYFTTYDHAAIRRGFEVYRQVCSSCHSINFLCYRNLVGVSHTEEQAKAIAKTIEVKGGPNEQGEYFLKKGALTDSPPAPFPNEEAARFANNGALPPDLSLITKARHDGLNYIFSLLTGYRDPPAGLTIREGLFYNPYFNGGAIAMAPPLLDGQVDNEDGVRATVHQSARDVVTFLGWVAEPDHDERRRHALYWFLGLAAAIITTGYYKRHKWNIFKNRRLSFREYKGPKH